MQLFKQTSIDFLRMRKAAYTFSGVLILAGLISLIAHGGPRYGIDFRGGTSIVLEFKEQVSVGQVRASLSKIGFGTAEIKASTSLRGARTGSDVLIRVEQGELSGERVAEKIKDQLTNDLPDKSYEVLSIESVGPKIGAELRRAATLAIFISLLLILIYISWRFEFRFAVGAVVALFHDVLITLGIFSLLNMEICLVVVAAFLTLVGYSLNDTIVVFDRIRENLKIMRRENIHTIVNTSINQSLSRTVITALTTLMVLIVLFFIGGRVIHGFAFALLIGVTIGTYSSIFVASPIVVAWRGWLERRKLHREVARA
ncbi:MAG: protein translocase subunit SecF [bacterium]|nr:protein translocase subunit SecF [candidate division KSB1 bacterium]MDH7559668.1 protein translocase subunit SecF [bacterium]